MTAFPDLLASSPPSTGCRRDSHGRGVDHLAPIPKSPRRRTRVDSMRQRVVQAFDQFRDIKETSLARSAELISNDGVDILVDLKGHTQNSRTQILALRPAPVQVNYLGYPGTMGADFMDYILVDDFVVPRDQQPYFTERLVHLPGCYQVNDSQRLISPHTPTRCTARCCRTGRRFNRRRAERVCPPLRRARFWRSGTTALVSAGGQAIATASAAG